MSEGASDEKTCATCRHWHRLPRDTNDLSERPKGQCREQAHLFALPTRGGGVAFGSGYATTCDDFPACSRHQAVTAFQQIIGESHNS